ncbi:MAG: hypothetical protein EXR05_09840 [Acetobacteraceae bacterium]|nr:hypothetical protein [Acetobacteraceae bacterium]MSP30047.1 hypothetical protein [Acetobacteraceae bacterium]
MEGGQISIGAPHIPDIELSLNSSDARILTLSGRMGMPGRGAGHAWNVSARLGQPWADGRAALEATASGRERLAGINLAVAERLGGQTRLVGHLRAKGPDLSQLMAARVLRLSGCGARRTTRGVAIAAVLDGAVHPPSLRLNGVVTGARIAGLLAGDLPQELADGGRRAADLHAERADFTLTLSGAGEDLAAVGTNLAGPMEARGTAVTWKGFDLVAVSDLLERSPMLPVTDTVFALRASLTNGQTPFTQVEMTDALRDGVLSLRHLQAHLARCMPNARSGYGTAILICN